MPQINIDQILKLTPGDDKPRMELLRSVALVGIEWLIKRLVGGYGRGWQTGGGEGGGPVSVSVLVGCCKAKRPQKLWKDLISHQEEPSSW